MSKFMAQRAISLIILAALSPSVAGQDNDDPIQELDTLFVSAPGGRENTANPSPASVLEGDDLRLKVGSTLGETLKQEPGISSQSFGPGVGTPVIRGQAGSRVKVLQNGLGNNDASNFSPDHANGLEPVLADRVEVLRGPSTLLYGSGAIGGVVNVSSHRIAEQQPAQPITAAAEQRYDSALNQTNSTFKVETGTGNMAYHLDGFYRDGGDMTIGGSAIHDAAFRGRDPRLAATAQRQNTLGYVDNTQAQAKGGSFGLSRTLDAGFVGAAINYLDNVYGIPPDGSGALPVMIDMQQSRYEFKGGLLKPSTAFEAVRASFNHSDYRHVELENGESGTTWSHQSDESRLELQHRPLGPLRGSVGFQSAHSDFAAIGAEAVVPASKINTYSAFAAESLQTGAMTYQLGARVEHQAIAAQGKAERGDLPVSGAAASLWNFAPGQSVNLAFTQSQRAPQVQELYTYGVHQATRSFEMGHSGLNKEISSNLELGYTLKRDGLNAELNLFHNWVKDYIYQDHTGRSYDEANEVFTDGAGIPVLAYRQADTVFKGYEGKLIFPLMDNATGMLDLTLFSDYTRGQFQNGRDVPRMPPLRYGLQLEYGLKAWSGTLRLTRGESQDHPGQNESSTPGYLKLDLGTQYQVKASREAHLLLFARASNLLDENIRNSSSYLRNFAPEPGRAAQLGLRFSYY